LVSGRKTQTCYTFLCLVQNDCNARLTMWGGGHLVTKGIPVRVGEEGQGVPQRNRKGSTLRRPTVHPQPPLRCNIAAGPRGGLPDAFSLERRRRRRLSEGLL